MRTITTNIFTFDELSEDAKAVARKWMRDCLAHDPPWLSEHSGSYKAADRFCRAFDTVEALKEATEALRANPAKACPWTGYCGDETALDGILAACDAETEVDQVREALRRHMERAWEAEMEDMFADAQVDDLIRANEYEFTTNGKRA